MLENDNFCEISEVVLGQAFILSGKIYCRDTCKKLVQGRKGIKKIFHCLRSEGSTISRGCPEI